jgi:ATP-dependent Clp protease ATP-binding subunit ClpA
MRGKFRAGGAHFHPAAGQAVVNAAREARRAGQDQIRTEHVLLGLLAVPGPACAALTAAGVRSAELREHLPAPSTGLDADALASIGIDLDAIRRATDAAFGPGALERAGQPGPRRLELGADAKRAVASAAELASDCRSRQISSGHLLLGVLDQAPSGAVDVLSESGVDLTALRSDVWRRIDPAVN